MTGAEVIAGDLDADQCTLYYLISGSDPRIRRYDACRRMQLADVRPMPICSGDPAPRAALRVARDGALLVAACSGVYRVTSGGSVRTYPLAATAVAPTSDARFFWAGSSSLSLVEVATGNMVAGPYPLPGTGPVTSLEISGTLRAAAARPLSAVPTLSRFLLIVLAAGLAVVALRPMHYPG